MGVTKSIWLRCEPGRGSVNWAGAIKNSRIEGRGGRTLSCGQRTIASLDTAASSPSNKESIAWKVDISSQIEIIRAFERSLSSGK